MRKFILMALVASAAAIYQPAKAQVSLSVNIGAQPRYASVAYYHAPVVHRSYYAPAPRVVYVNNNNWSNRKHYKTGRRVISSHYNRPSVRYYNVKQVKYKHYNKPSKHGRGHGKGRR